VEVGYHTGRARGGAPGFDIQDAPLAEHLGLELLTFSD
jgi:hypothetical protein